MAGKIVTIVGAGRGERRWGFLKRRNGTHCWQDRKDYANGGWNAPCSPSHPTRTTD